MSDDAPLNIPGPPPGFPDEDRQFVHVPRPIRAPHDAAPITYAPAPAPTPVARIRNSEATAALVTGVISMALCTFVIPSILAIMLGIGGIRFAAAQGRQGMPEVGKSAAIAGLLLGAASVLLAIFTYTQVIDL